MDGDSDVSVGDLFGNNCIFEAFIAKAMNGMSIVSVRRMSHYSWSREVSQEV